VKTSDELLSVDYGGPTTGPSGTLEHHFAAELTWGRVTFVFGEAAGPSDPLRIVIEPTNSATLPAEAVRRIRLAGIRNKVAQRANHPLARMFAGVDPSSIEPWLENPRPGRRGRDDFEYALWASRYVEALDAGPRPIMRLLEAHPGHSAAMLRAILNKARHRGLLTPSEPGRAGGRLTQKGLDLLAQLDDV
jgi:hypothetical protein